MKFPYRVAFASILIGALLCGIETCSGSESKCVLRMYSNVRDRSRRSEQWPLVVDNSFEAGVPSKGAVRVRRFGGGLSKQVSAATVVVQSPRKGYFHTFLVLQLSSTRFVLPMPYIPYIGAKKVVPKRNGPKKEYLVLGVCWRGRCLCVPGKSGLGKGCGKVESHEGMGLTVIMGAQILICFLWQWSKYTAAMKKHCTLSVTNLFQRPHSLALAPVSNADVMACVKDAVMFMSVTGLIQGEVSRQQQQSQPRSQMSFLSADAWMLLVYFAGCWAAFAGEVLALLLCQADTGLPWWRRCAAVQAMGGRGGALCLLGYLSQLNNGLEFTMSYFMVPVPLRLTALKCLALNVCLDFVLGGGRRSPAALLLSSALAASAGVAAFQLA